MDKQRIKKIILIIALSILMVSSLLMVLQYYSQPECYLIEQENRCGMGYYYKSAPCYIDLKLSQCCKGQDYLLKGVYGDLTCWWILSGQNQSLLE